MPHPTSFRAPFGASLTVACLSLIGAAPLSAQPPAAGNPPIVWRAGALVSIQPAGHAGPPYLSEGLGGVVPGGGVGLDLRLIRGWLLGVEMNTTWPMRRLQVGRSVQDTDPGGPRGAGRAIGSHNDTLVSVLPSFLGRGDGWHLILRAGVSLVLGTPSRGDEQENDNVAGRVAFTTGIDAPVMRGRLDITPYGRYSLARRGSDVAEYGLGRHVVRVGVDFRWGQY